MIYKFLPFLQWFKDYSTAKFKIDFLAGLTVALVLIPQSMAYAQLAGLPAYYGLYAAFLPPMVASLFGSSRQLATGPVAVVSLMTAASLEPLASRRQRSVYRLFRYAGPHRGYFPVSAGGAPAGAHREFPVPPCGQRIYKCGGHYYCIFPAVQNVRCLCGQGPPPL